MAINGESIYGTSASPFPKPSWGRFTKRKGKLYAHIFDRPEEGTIEISVDPSLLKGVYFLDGGEKLGFTTFRASGLDGSVSVKLPENLPDAAATVVVFEIHE